MIANFDGSEDAEVVVNGFKELYQDYLLENSPSDPFGTENQTDYVDDTSYL